MAPFVWLITGTSSGLGHSLTIAALERGDKVIATARSRSLHKLEDLKQLGADTIELDVTDSPEKLKEIAKRAVELYGRVDILVNNAGYALIGAIEENTAEETFDQFNTNVFGALNLTRALLPYMRQKRSGTIIWIGSLAGWVGEAHSGIYCATKYALRGINESLHHEISPLGLRSTCIDLGYFRTNFLSPGHIVPPSSQIEDYEKSTADSNQGIADYDQKQPGDPSKAAKVLIDLAHGEGVAAGKPWPTQLILGSDCYGVVKAQSETNLVELDRWREVSLSTDFPA